MPSLFDELKESWTRHSPTPRKDASPIEGTMEGMGRDGDPRSADDDIEMPRTLARRPLSDDPADALSGGSEPLIPY